MQNWLEKVFGGEEVPAYELNSRTISILYELMLRNDRFDKSTCLISDDLKQKAEEYAAEGKSHSVDLEKKTCR